jgi:phenylpyruvate tautomerase PptA (4-oxalocrotonate tautomerase family)
MPVYTCTTTTSTLTADIKGALAHEIARIHAEINHVPSTYVNVVFHALPAGGIYTDGVPANPVLVNGWVRSGHPEDKPLFSQRKSPPPCLGSRMFLPTGCSW